MAGFAPTFEGNMGIEQPVAAPTSGLGSVVDVLSIFSKNAPTTTPDRAPSEDERNANLWKGVMGNKNLDTASIEDLQFFARKHPSAGSWAYGAAEDMLNENLATETTELTATQKIESGWMESPQGQLALMQSNQVEDPAARDALIATERARYVANAAQSAALTQEMQQSGVNDTRRKEMWTQEAFDLRAGANLIASAFTDAIDMLNADPNLSINLDDTGITAKLPQLEGTVLNSTNAVDTIKKLREAYLGVQTQRVASVRGLKTGDVGFMPDDIEADVFRSFDTQLAWAELKLDPAEIRKRTDNTTYNKMIEIGVPLDLITSMSLSAAGNASLQAAFTAAVTEGQGAVLELYNGAEFQAARQATRDLSRDERDNAFAGFSQVAKLWGGTSTIGNVYEEVNETKRVLGFGSATVAALDVAITDAKLSGQSVRFGREFYRGNIEAMASKFDAAAAANPQFAPAVHEALSSDLNMQMQETNQKANAEGYRVSTDSSGKVFFAPTDETLGEIATREQDIAKLEKGIAANPQDPFNAANVSMVDSLKGEIEALKTPPTDIPLTDIQYKWSVLGNLGKVGSEVRTTVGAAFNLEVDASVAKEAKAALAGDTPVLAANGSVATNLGIDFASMESQAGLPAGFLERTAQIESSGDPAAQNSESSAGGLFQQIDKNAREFGVVDRFDPMQSTEGAIKFAQQNQRILSGALGRDPTAAELYLAHQQGGGGAKALLSNPNESALSVLTSLYKGNEGRARDAIRNNGGALDMTAGQFANIWINKFNKGGFAPGAPQVTTTELGEKTSAPATSMRPEARPVGVGSSASAPTTSIRPEARATSEGEAPAQPAGGSIPFERIKESLASAETTPTMIAELEAFLENLKGKK